MKIKKLNIHNLASIEDAEIDFESEPLKSSEVFLITGKTGSGKSTLLDAICLALYAKTPRLENTSMNGKVEEKLDSDNRDKVQEVAIDDERNLLRRKTGEGWAKLWFEGTNNVNYVATWSVTRAHKKATGNLQPKHWELENLDAGITLSKDKEIEAEMAKAIGLDFPQFCRTAMLAQGEFTKFLNSSDKEKSEILEKITGVNIYSKIGVKIFEKARDYEEQYRQQKSAVEQVKVMTEEERETQIAEQKRIAEEETALLKKHEADDKRKNWLQAEEKAKKEQQECATNYDRVRTMIESEAFKAEEKLTSEWRQTEGARMWLSQYHQNQATIEKQEQRLEALVGEYKICVGGELWRGKLLEEKQQGLQLAKQYLESEAYRATVYDREQAIEEQLKSLLKNRRDWTINGLNIKREQEGLKPLQEANEQAEKSLQEAVNQYEMAVKQLEVADKELKEMGLPAIREAKEGMVKKMGDLKQAQMVMKSWSGAQNRCAQAKGSVAELQKSMVEKEQALGQASKGLEEAKEQYAKSKAQLEAMELSVNELAATMRSGLKEGDICPVCGQEVKAHLIPVEENLKNAYQLTLKMSQEAEEKRKACESRVNELNSIVAGLKHNIKQGEIAMATAEKEVEEAHQQVVKQMMQCGIEGEENEAQLQERWIQMEVELKGVAEQLSRGEMKEKEVDNIRKIERKALELRDKMKGQKDMAANRVKECENRIAAIEMQQAKLKEGEETILQQVGELIVDEGWKNEWKTATELFIEELKGCGKRYKEAQERKLKLEQDVELMQKDIEQNATIRQKILEKCEDWRSIEVEAQHGAVEHLNRRWNDLQNSLVETLQQRQTAQETQREVAQKLNQFRAEHPDLQRNRLEFLGGITETDIIAKEHWIKGQHDEKNQSLGKLNICKTQYEKILAERPEIAEGESMEVIVARMTEDEEKIRGLQQDKGAIQQRLKDDDERKTQQSDLLKKIEKLQAQAMKWGVLKEMFGDANGSKFRTIAQSYILASLLESANCYMSTLSKRYTLLGQPGTFIIMLSDSYQGGAKRAASTLSGGESFLVSLSLALALSDIGQRLSVDTLFIDEGFGTLSGTPLEDAINTLRQLHSTGGRRVGIISHVENLKEQLPVQIQVDQVGNSSYSEVRVVG